MWSVLRLYLNTSWLYSLLLAVSCLTLCWPLLKLISILRRLKKLNLQNEKSVRTSDLKIASERSKTPFETMVSLSSTGITKLSAILVILVCTVFAMGMVSLVRKSQCTATGDFAESDHMTVISKEGDWYNVLAKDGRTYKFYPCPPSHMGWKAGTVIEYAKYEMRDGCADFSSPLASVVAH